LEAGEGFTDRRSAEAEAQHEFCVAQPLAGSERAVDDRRPKHGVGLVTE
jgi:hypothetical protein